METLLMSVVNSGVTARGIHRARI